MKTYREAIFSGWFGPMGVGAVFLSIIAKEELETAYEGKESPVSIQVISPVVLFIVFCSVIVHGTTIPLFKLGKRIRTRTLSITSISSNQVLRLPKLQFGQQVSKHDHKKEEGGGNGGNGGGGGMTELERNTLFNTLQHDHIKEDNHLHPLQPQHQKQLHHGFTVDMSNKQSDSDSDMAEEDFLPDDASVTSQPKSLLVPDPMCEDIRRASAISLDTQQAIRFLEPVKPRVTNTEKNETSATSLKSWLTRSKEEESETEEHVHGIKSLFKRMKDHKTGHESHTIEEEEIPKIETMFSSERIQVWEEKNHVVVEDSQGSVKEVVIDKANYLNWKKKTKEKIKEVEHKINTGDTS